MLHSYRQVMLSSQSRDLFSKMIANPFQLYQLDERAYEAVYQTIRWCTADLEHFCNRHKGGKSRPSRPTRVRSTAPLGEPSLIDVASLEQSFASQMSSCINHAGAVIDHDGVAYMTCGHPGDSLMNSHSGENHCTKMIKNRSTIENIECLSRRRNLLHI